jgi:hypothetical protein
MPSGKRQGRNIVLLASQQLLRPEQFREEALKLPKEWILGCQDLVIGLSQPLRMKIRSGSGILGIPIPREPTEVHIPMSPKGLG